MQAIHMSVYFYFSAQGMPTQTYYIWNCGAFVPRYTMTHLSESNLHILLWEPQVPSSLSQTEFCYSHPVYA